MAMTLRILKPAVFFAEYQNEPEQGLSQREWADADAIAARVTGLKRGEIPTACTTVTAYIDVHKSILYWAVMAWKNDATGYVIDYGTYPRQSKRYFSQSNPMQTLQRAHQGAGEDGSIHAGLTATCDEILTREFRRDDGVNLRVHFAMIDANWKTKLVHDFIQTRRNMHLYPAKGIGLTASSRPWEDRPDKDGEKPGDHCRIAVTPNKTAMGFSCVFDTNHWKTNIQTGLTTPQGEPGAIMLFGSDPSAKVSGPDLHRLFADHLTAETSTETLNKRYGNTVIEWRLSPARPDNHWLDCVVGCAVLANVWGVSSIPKSVDSVTNAASPSYRTRKSEIFI